MGGSTLLRCLDNFVDCYRNTIEHVDEHNNKVIEAYKGVGGFNYIDDTTEKELMEFLRRDRKKHTYTLDLLQSQIYIERNNNDLTLDIEQLKQELISLKKSVTDFYDFIKDPLL